MTSSTFFWTPELKSLELYLWLEILLEISKPFHFLKAQELETCVVSVEGPGSFFLPPKGPTHRAPRADRPGELACGRRDGLERGPGNGMGWLAGWLDGWMDGWMEGGMGATIFASVFSAKEKVQSDKEIT